MDTLAGYAAWLRGRSLSVHVQTTSDGAESQLARSAPRDTARLVKTVLEAIGEAMLLTKELQQLLDLFVNDAESCFPWRRISSF